MSKEMTQFASTICSVVDQGNFSMGELSNPKRSPSTPNSSPYSYYAGFSSAFVESAIRNCRLGTDALILDPWNGAGTTTTCSSIAGHQAIGVDLNPVMNIVARGVRASSFRSTIENALGLLIGIESTFVRDENADPLNSWFSRKSVLNIRKFISRTTTATAGVYEPGDSESIADEEALLLVCLFSLLKAKYLASPYKSSNPTWVKPIPQETDRIRVSPSEITIGIEKRLRAYLKSAPHNQPPGPEPRLILADSRYLPLPTASIDAVITSPPYCTRIDYAVKTSIEHSAAFGKNGFEQLRRALLGTTTVDNSSTEIDTLSPYCRNLLLGIQSHTSKASDTYYLKNIAQYFNGLAVSMREIARVLKAGGDCLIVVQDSHYKEIPIRLDIATRELGSAAGLREIQTTTFRTFLTMANINTASRQYRNNSTEAKEHVLHLRRN